MAPYQAPVFTILIFLWIFCEAIIRTAGNSNPHVSDIRSLLFHTSLQKRKKKHLKDKVLI